MAAIVAQNFVNAEFHVLNKRKNNKQCLLSDKSPATCEAHDQTNFPCPHRKRGPSRSKLTSIKRIVFQAASGARKKVTGGWAERGLVTKFVK